MCCKWIWLVVAGLMLASLFGCGQAVAPLSAEIGPSRPAETMVDGQATATPTLAATPQATPSPPETGTNPTASPDGSEVSPVVSTPIPTPPTQIVQEETVSVVPTPSAPGLQKMVTQAKEDLARRLSIAVDQIELVELQTVVWPDGSLGCPQPGMAYIQVQVEGLLIRLRAERNIYEYHSGGNRPPFLCEQATK